MKKVVIVGGVAGGASAAARLRRLDEQAEIIIFEKDEYISFANCGLPYYIGGSITERSNLILQSPQAMKARFNIDVRINSEVVSVNTDTNIVNIKEQNGKEYSETYDYLILSPGAQPSAMPFENMAISRTFTVRNIPDIDKIKSFICDNDVKSAVVIGGGFIGVEMAENLREIGVSVTLIEAADNILLPFDREMAIITEKEMEKHGVELLTCEFVESISEHGNNATVLTKSGKKIKTDMVISAIGVSPATEFLKDSKVNLAHRGHIITNDCMQTNILNIYAVGDAVLVNDFIAKNPVAIPLAGPANKQGRIVADQIAGLDHRYNGTMGSSVVKVFGITAACTGLNEKTLEKQHIEYKAIYTHPFSHATYYPGAKQISCKMLMALDGTILGCQIVGEDGVEKRLDVIATAMRLGAKAQDLCELELSYAPPYSSAKDPVNMLGYIAQNIIEGRSSLVDYKYLLARDIETTIVLDVRTEKEFKLGHVEDSLNIPVDELRGRLAELDKSKEIILYCQVGVRAHVAERILANKGYNVKNVSGGWKTISSIIKQKI